ncbi:ATP-binding cassette domain-containing protein [Asanoa ferruginea]|nr:ATP-binding cassette domain-containing protein [Asanoa ferruginea]
MANAIVAERLGKTYGSVTAVADLDLAVPEGTVFGLLGPNGAGKTTTVRMLTTLITPTSGHCEVGGIDVCAHPEQVRRIIGVSGQYAAVDDYLTGYENLEMVGRLYHLGRRKARQRAKDLLEQFDLADAADRPAKTYSGGMRRRLDLAGALVVHPPVIFLDEPTTGLDPRSRLGMWGVIRDLVKAGSTLLLTTQYLEEADQLCDDIVVMDHGRAIARGTAGQLKGQIGGERLAVAVGEQSEVAAAADVLRSIGVGDPEVDNEAREVTVPIDRGTAALVEAVRKLDAAEITPTNLEIRKPTLDDVFLKLTGQPPEEQQGVDDGGTA